MQILTNRSDAAWLNAAETGHHWVQLPGQQVYRDSTGIWYSYGWGQWSYSIDTCATWHEVPMLQFHIVAGSGAVDYFDGHSWIHQNGKLQFFDTNYAMSGWHEMAEFAVEYYDGVGYDGEPLKVVDGWETTQSSDPDAPAVVTTLTLTGEQPNPAPTGQAIEAWKTWVYGQWTEKLVASWKVPHPSSDFRPDTYTQPLTVVCRASDLCPGLVLCLVIWYHRWPWRRTCYYDVTAVLFMRLTWQTGHWRRRISLWRRKLRSSARCR